MVVIADDSAAVIRGFHALVESIPGVRIAATASDVRGAIRAVRRYEPDLLIVDVRMPDGTGFDVIAGLDGEAKRPAVLMMTGMPTPAVRRRAYDAGADGFFDKAREIDVFLEELRRRAAIVSEDT